MRIIEHAIYQRSVAIIVRNYVAAVPGIGDRGALYGITFCTLSF